MDGVLRVIFGAKAQGVIGVAALLGSIGYWIFGPRTVESVFHISMFFGCVACYSVIATALGYRATERVETAVVENIENAENVDVND